MLFDWLVVGQVVPFNPASSVRGPPVPPEWLIQQTRLEHRMHFIDDIRNPQGWCPVLFQSPVGSGLGIACLVLNAEHFCDNGTVACVENVFDLIEQEDDFSAEEKDLRSMKRPQTRLVSENFRSQGSNRIRPNLPSSKSMDLLIFFVRSVH